MTHTLVTIAVPAMQLADANAAMVGITGNPADAQTFVAQEWAFTDDAETGFAVMSNLFDAATVDLLSEWRDPIMVRTEMQAMDAIVDMGLVSWLDPDAPVPDVIDKAAITLSEERKGMVVSRLQGRLTLGPQTVSALDAFAADPNTPWAMQKRSITLLNGGARHRRWTNWPMH